MGLCVFLAPSLPQGAGNQTFLAQVMEVTAKPTSNQKGKNVLQIWTGVYFKSVLLFWSKWPTHWAIFFKKIFFNVKSMNIGHFVILEEKLNTFKLTVCLGHHLPKAAASSQWDFCGRFQLSILQSVAWFHWGFLLQRGVFALFKLKWHMDPGKWEQIPKIHARRTWFWKCRLQHSQPEHCYPYAEGLHCLFLWDSVGGKRKRYSCGSRTLG